MELMIIAWLICLALAIFSVCSNNNLTGKDKAKVIVAIMLLFTLLLFAGQMAVGKWEV